VSGQLPRARGDVEQVVIDGETVIYDPVDEAVHHLNATATVIWRCCDGHGTVDELVAELVTTYGAPAQQVGTEVRALLDDLARRGLVAPAGTP